MIIDITGYDSLVLKETERRGSVVVAHGSLPARAGRGGYPVMIYQDGEYVRWRRAFPADRLLNMGVLDTRVVWNSEARDYDVLYVRTWKEPLCGVPCPSDHRLWLYEKASCEEIIRFALEKREAYNAVADIATLAANARNYRLLGEDENGRINVALRGRERHRSGLEELQDPGEAGEIPQPREA